MLKHSCIYKVQLSCYCHASNKGERRYSSYSFLTSALDGVSGQRHALAMLYSQGKDPWPPLDMDWIILGYME
jgi:hypothetical protein